MTTTNSKTHHTTRIAVVDTETTGLDPHMHEVWEVGLIDRDGGEHEWLLPVERLATADPFALQIGGFHERHPQGNQGPCETDNSELARTMTHPAATRRHCKRHPKPTGE